MESEVGGVNMLKLDFHGRVAVVTGSSSGIGKAYAMALAEQGADVALLARRVEKLEEVARACTEKGVRALPVRCDVSDEASIKEAVAAVMAEFGRIDILINNAGGCEWALLEHHTSEMWNNVITTDLTSVFLMTREVAPIFRQQGYGRVVNTSSVGSIEAGPTQIGYYAAKGGVDNLTRALASELAEYGVLVNAIAPGVVMTDLASSDASADTDMDLDGVLGDRMHRMCVKHFAGPEELCPQMLLFASEENTYCTGQVVFVDGGLTAML